MSVTDNMKKQRVAKSAPVKLGQWHADFSTVKKYADSKNVPLLAVWSNGDACGHCVMFEQCLLDSKFKTWAKTSGVAMWIGFGSDTSKEDKFEGTGFKFSRKGTLTSYPFVRLYWKKGKVDLCKSGGKLTGDTAKGAAKLVSAFKTALKGYCPDCEPTPSPTPETKPQYVIRLNENVTTAQVNKILDAIDACGGYCPCQIQSEDTKCHCKDFIEKKAIGEPCICNVYVKKEKAVAKKSTAKNRKKMK